jgi:WhiB family redox-sensing transcriptional regulator
MSSPRAKARHGGPVTGSNPRLIDIFAALTRAVTVPDEDIPRSATAEDLGWQDRALCAETDPEAFFPEKGGSTREAKKVCRFCEVRAECLEYALENGERYGIWGGLSERERRRISRQAA